MKKGFIVGLATGLTVAGASLVLASSQIQAILNDQIKVTLNGQVQEFKDETTNETQYPITYKDRTYLPLRTVANLVGVDVDYDANSNTAELKNSFSNYYDEEHNIMSIAYRHEEMGYSYEIYNIKSGSIISTEELMKLKGISETDVNNALDRFIDGTIALNEGRFKDEEKKEAFRNETKSLNNLSRISIFINKSGAASLVVKCPIPDTMNYEEFCIEL